jgi:hypothetical protein
VKRWLWAGLFVALPVVAQEAAPTPVRFGYAVEDTDVLLRQRLFGLAHGVHLLLSACLDKNENAAAVQRAYEAWHAAQAPAIEAIRVALAEHHFGVQASRAGWQDIARVLGLKETIYPALGTVSLEEACATLPAALSRPAYDFATQLGMTHAAASQQ